MTDKLPKFLWLWIPLAIIIAQIALELFVPAHLKTPLHSEGGPHETLQFVFALLALIWGVRCLLLPSLDRPPLLTGWIICFIFGCAYIAGEEVSWGQHILDWGTPDFWAQVNDQNETNLHNTSSWLNQKPRLILLIGVIVGGLIIPALRHFKSAIVPKAFEIIYPPACLCVVAALALGVKIIDKIDPALPDIIILSRASEVEELYLFYFVLLYMVVLYRRLSAVIQD